MHRCSVLGECLAEEARGQEARPRRGAGLDGGGRSGRAVSQGMRQARVWHHHPTGLGGGLAQVRQEVGLGTSMQHRCRAPCWWYGVWEVGRVRVSAKALQSVI